MTLSFHSELPCWGHDMLQLDLFFCLVYYRKKQAVHLKASILAATVHFYQLNVRLSIPQFQFKSLIFITQI